MLMSMHSGNKIAGTTKKYDKGSRIKHLINNIQKFSETHLYYPGTTGPILYIYLFSAIAIIVLFVGCINFINLITARASVRGKEIGMRKVIGATKKHIVWQFYGETFLTLHNCLWFGNSSDRTIFAKF